MRTICFYHSKDLDGFASGAIVKLKYPEAILIGFDYGQEFPVDKLMIDDEIIMIDVSLPITKMFDVARQVKSFIWIDHHKSAIDEFHDYTRMKKYPYGYSSNITEVLEDGTAACEIGWKYFFPYINVPKAVRLLSQYDTWQNNDKALWDGMILPFQYGMRQICNSPETFPEELFLETYDTEDDKTYDIIRNGSVILSYQAKISELACKKWSFECDIDGYRAICLNGGGFNSDVFKSTYNPEKHDIMMPFVFNGKEWVVSLYTFKDIDVSQIAKSRGGGGHEKAAGFMMKNLDDILSLGK